jgi:hypothetical protein
MLAVLLVSTTASAARPMPPGFPAGTSWNFVKGYEPPTALAVGETKTIRIEVRSDDREFLQAIAMINAYYPGRGVSFSGGDRVVNDTYALLELTIKGKNSTADLPGVCDWPLPGTPCTPDGAAPLAIAIGLRYKRGEVYGEYIPFAVTVP